MINRMNVLMLIALTGLLVGCGSSAPKKQVAQAYVVKKEVVHKKLFFTGTIQPLHESSITSPIDASLETMYYHYGQLVKKGDVILTLNSSELQKQYNETLTDYLKAKDSYTVAQSKFTGTQDLWDAGLLSKNNYLSEKSNLATARVSMMQASRKLSEMLEKMDDGSKKSLSALSLTQFDKVNQALSSKHNQISLKAPAEGILLYPPKGNDDKSGRLVVGSMVKSGQVIALIGDLTGISIEIDVPEVDIDKIYAGMPATVTGIALGGQVLRGELVAVNAQASTGSGGALPSFSAVVEVKALNEEQRRWIRVGMSASIELSSDSNNQLLVPINAVRQEKGQSVVKLKDKSGSTKTQIVTTGIAQADKVVIASGLNEGDVVAYD